MSCNKHCMHHDEDKEILFCCCCDKKISLGTYEFIEALK